ncbi:MAG: archaetidylserine decarboxylase [Gammaproteobacteria bacterium]|nr:archaetidylserine decarboxylase [Gammaproteobacteria bacterium]MDH3768382.1 archaetidylserine decarboxylase [Gammaproteobacteria bacterium]
MENLLAGVQSLLPQHSISRLVGRLARTRLLPVRKLLIHSFVRLYKIDLTEAEHNDPDAYPSFNALFTRALRPDARPAPSDPRSIVSPVDGTISQVGEIDSSLLVQAKDRRFTVAELFGDASEFPGAYEHGRFVTIYLAPHNYHRIHMPLTARLSRMTYIPGRLFSVSPRTTRAVSHLFARNERVVFHFDSDHGPIALVMVGAMNVGSIETVHEGVVAPGGKKLRQWTYNPSISFQRSQELARFNLGSTAIVLFSNDGPQLAHHLHPASTIMIGETIARA